MVGAKEVVDRGRKGWVVPAGEIAALADQMTWCARHPEAVRGMREACRRSAEAATWPAYHRRLAELLRAIVPERAATGGSCTCRRGRRRREAPARRPPPRAALAPRRPGRGRPRSL